MTLFSPSSVGVVAGDSRMSIIISRQSKAISMGEVVIEVHGMEREREEQYAEETLMSD